MSVKNVRMALLALALLTGMGGRAEADDADAAQQMDENAGVVMEGRLGALEIRGQALFYYQGSRTGEFDGADAGSPGGPGATADLELAWKPALPLLEDGKFYARVHAGGGTGADQSGNRNNNPVDVLLGNLNTIADDNTGRSGTSLNLLEAHYTREFFDKALNITGGKANSLLFLDGNAFANNEKQQFVGKPFVNNSVLDSESEYTPLLGMELKPTELLALSLVATSTSRPNVEGTPLEDTAKSKYDNVFSTPFIGSQLTLSPKFGELEGNYRLYGWWAGYNHSKLDSDRNAVAGRAEKGYGVGISADQQLSRTIGVFGRFAWNNDEVYVVEWEASGGLSLKGLIPKRDEDVLGLGVAALIPGDRYAQNDPEWHFELYYRIAVTENLAFSPDLQVVINPGGDSQNDPVFAGMLRAEFNF